MTYCNIAFRMGARRFASELVAAGFDGAILPDVPMEELDTWGPAAEAAAPADGVVVASALMRILLDGGSPEDAGALTRSLREALDG
jgi:tryptophan synthase alpha subunit